MRNTKQNIGFDFGCGPHVLWFYTSEIHVIV